MLAGPVKREDDERMTFTKGKSGNSKGRPPSQRSLAMTLRTMGDHDSFGALSNKVLLAQMIWEGLAYGKIRFAGGDMLNLSAREWLDLVKWVHLHVDGAYQPEPAVEQSPQKEVWDYDSLTEEKAAEKEVKDVWVYNPPQEDMPEEEAWDDRPLPQEVIPEDDPEEVRKANEMLMRLVNEG